jgi:hypothetical protein
MALQTSIFAPVSASGGVEDVQKASAIANGASSAEIVIGPRTIFAVVAMPTAGQSPNGYANIRFGPAGLAAATASDFGFPFGVVLTFDTGEEFNSIRLFNGSSVAGTVDFYVMRLSRAK